MRIAYFTQTPRMGGAERVLVQMARAAVAAGHEVSVLSPEAFLVDHVREAVPGARAVRVGDASFHDRPTMAGRGAVLARQVPQVAAALRATRADVLHVSNGGHPGSGLALLTLPLARAAGIRRRVLSVHARPRPRTESVVAVQKGFDRMAWGNVEAVAVATRFVADRLTAERGMPPGLARLVPYGVPAPGGAERAAALRAEHGIPPDAPLALMVSAASDEQKGHHVLAAALEHAPGTYGLIVGAPPPVPFGERAVVAGRLDDLGPAYHAADVLVVPSVRDESLPLVILEAMAAGTPVLASRLSGIPEAVEDGVTGRLFPPGDVAALAALLRDVPALTALGPAARRRWQERFSEHAAAQATLALYAGLRGPTSQSGG